jgi:hypothetical protein
MEKTREKAENLNKKRFSKPIIRKKKKQKRINKAERLEMACSYAYLESLHYDMRLMRKEERRHSLMLKIYKQVHEKNGYADYVR